VKAAATWCLMLGLFAAANIVAGGVILLFGITANRIYPGAAEDLVWPWFLIGLAGVAAAVLFLRGAMAEARPLRRFYTRG